MSLFNKVKWVLGILTVFAIILATNQIDKSNFIKVQQSVETIYADRLVAKDLILNFTLILHKKEVALAAQDDSSYISQNNALNSNMDKYLEQFKGTELTQKEERVLQRFNSHFEDLRKAENNFFTLSQKEEVRPTLHSKIALLKTDLQELSKIQIEEGRRQMMMGRKAIDNMELFTKIEIYLMAFLAICIQVLILYRPKKENSFDDNDGM